MQYAENEKTKLNKVKERSMTDEEINGLVRLADVYRSQGKLEQAEACLLNVPDNYSIYIDAQAQLGEVYRLQGKLKQAEVCFLIVPDHSKYIRSQASHRTTFWQTPSEGLARPSSANNSCDGFSHCEFRS